MIGTFLPRSPKIIVPKGNNINIFTQMEQPETFNGIWIQTEDQYENIVTDTEWFFGGEFDKTSDFVKNLCTTIRNITINTSGGSTGFYVKTFIKYLDDYYIIIGDKWNKNELYKIIIEDQNNVSLSKIRTFSGTFEQIYQFGPNNKFIIWSGNVTGNGDSNNYTYVYNFETDELKNIASIGFMHYIEKYKGHLFYMYGYSTSIYLHRADIDFENPVSITSTSYSTIGDSSYFPLLVYDNKLLMIRNSNNGDVTEILFDEETLSATIGEKIFSFRTDLGLKYESNNIEFDQRGYAFVTSQGILIYIGGYSSGTNYFMCDIKNKSIIQKGTLSDILYAKYSNNYVRSNTGSGFGRIIEEKDGTLFGCFALDGVLKYNVESKQYDDNTVILSKTNPVTGTYYTELVSYDDIEDLNDGIHLFKTGFNDVLYFHNGSLDNTLPTYYGDGTQWIKFKN